MSHNQKSTFQIENFNTLALYSLYFSVVMDVSLNVLKLAKITSSSNTAYQLLLTTAKVNVDFANCADQKPKKFLNVPLTVLPVNKAVSTLAIKERPNVLLVELCKSL